MGSEKGNKDFESDHAKENDVNESDHGIEHGNEHGLPKDETPPVSCSSTDIMISVECSDKMDVKDIPAGHKKFQMYVPQKRTVEMLKDKMYGKGFTKGSFKLLHKGVYPKSEAEVTLQTN